MSRAPATGTLRKSPDLWKKWTPASGVDLHTLQLEIASHAARLLKVGGRLVYSTCSLNPLEDEAVVAALLKRAKGALKLVDVSGELEGLKRKPGCTRGRLVTRLAGTSAPTAEAGGNETWRPRCGRRDRPRLAR
jgi:16S rRNA C967 or C1407 C5-methylase (RsmB/RsmF family)